MTKIIRGVVHGKTIEFAEELGLPDGQSVAVDVRPAVEQCSFDGQAPVWWLERLDINPSVRRGKFVIKGTQVLVDELVERLSVESEDKLLHDCAELTRDDIAAVREYAKLLLPMRSSFGASAEEAEDLDRHLQCIRRDRWARWSACGRRRCRWRSRCPGAGCSGRHRCGCSGGGPGPRAGAPVWRAAGVVDLSRRA